MKESETINVDTLLSLVVAEFSSPVIYCVNKGVNVESVLKKMDNSGVHHIPVMDKGRPVGIINKRDIQMIKKIKPLSEVFIEDVMDKDIYILSGDEQFDDVIDEMKESYYGCLFVEMTTSKSPFDLNILTNSDVLGAFVSILRGDIPTVGNALEDLDAKAEEDVGLKDIDLEKVDYDANLYPEQ